MTEALLPSVKKEVEEDSFISCSFRNTVFFVVLLLGGLLYLQVASTTECSFRVAIVAPATGYQSETELAPQKTPEPAKIPEEPKILETPKILGEPKNFCVPQKLVGALAIDFNMDKLEERFQELSESSKQFFENGEHKPGDCEVKKLKNIAIIIPFRDMTEDLFRTKQFLVSRLKAMRLNSF